VFCIQAYTSFLNHKKKGSGLAGKVRSHAALINTKSDSSMSSPKSHMTLSTI